MLFDLVPKTWFFKLWNFWPPFWGAGIQITSVSSDYQHVVVRLKLRPWNRNYVGTQYGGSMFSMTDPFYMVMFLQTLGKDYIVWDKSANIRYLKPGRSDVTAEFYLSHETLDTIRKALEIQDKMDWTTTIEIKNREGETVAEVEKILYIRRKKKS